MCVCDFRYSLFCSLLLTVCIPEENTFVFIFSTYMFLYFDIQLTNVQIPFYDYYENDIFLQNPLSSTSKAEIYLEDFLVFLHQKLRITGKS